MAKPAKRQAGGRGGKAKGMTAQAMKRTKGGDGKTATSSSSTTKPTESVSLNFGTVKTEYGAQ